MEKRDRDYRGNRECCGRLASFVSPESLPRDGYQRRAAPNFHVCPHRRRLPRGLSPPTKSVFVHQNNPRSFFSGGLSPTVTSAVHGLTSLAFQPTNDTVTLAMPLPASSGTRTGPWKRADQQRSCSAYLARTGLPPGCLGGNSTSTIGQASPGTPRL
jgi:hypothetical protein